MAILFISHDASRTGAPIALLGLLRWLRANTALEMHLLLRARGPLEAEFRKVLPVWSLEPASRWARYRAAISRRTGVLRGPRLTPRRLRRRLSLRSRIDLIYSNTVTNGSVLRALSTLGCPIVTHVHELDYFIANMMTAGRFEDVLKFSSFYIVPSFAARANLLKKYNVPDTKIEVVQNCVPARQYGEIHRGEGRRNLRRRLGIATDAQIVGGCGTLNWNKGPDVFVQLARLVAERFSAGGVHFVWAGGERQGEGFTSVMHDVKTLGLSGSVHFIGPVEEAVSVFSGFDVLALTSRQEAFSLVMLEVAALGIPSVAFARSGGPEEFIGEDCGFIVPYLDLWAMASKIGELLRSSQLRDRLGERARAKVLECHDVEVQAPKILSVITRLSGTG